VYILFSKLAAATQAARQRYIIQLLEANCNSNENCLGCTTSTYIFMGRQVPCTLYQVTKLHVAGTGKCFGFGFDPQTSHNIDCVLGFLCYIRTVFHLNCLKAQLSYEGRAAVEGAK
jgi:hypothetical protein